MLAAVLTAAVGLLGVSNETAVGSGGGYELELEYATIARAGQDVPWRLTVRKAGGFDGQLVVAISGSYFDLINGEGWMPSPDSETRSGERLYLTLESPPSGDSVVASFDGTVRSTANVGAVGTVAVVVEGVDVATVDFRTRLVP